LPHPDRLAGQDRRQKSGPYSRGFRQKVYLPARSSLAPWRLCLHGFCSPQLQLPEPNPITRSLISLSWHSPSHYLSTAPTAERFLKVSTPHLHLCTTFHRDKGLYL